MSGKKHILFTYSTNSLYKVKEMIQEMLDVFKSPLSPDDLFYYGLFCGISQYANNAYLNQEIEGIPPILASEQTSYYEKSDYVMGVIEDVLTGKIEKPEWMIEIEQSERCEDGCYAPSTFLYMKAKSEEYDRLGDKILDFLYSPSHEVSDIEIKNIC